MTAFDRAIAEHGVPEIFNTDQGCQFTSAEFTKPLLARRHRKGSGQRMVH